MFSKKNILVKNVIKRHIRILIVIIISLSILSCNGTKPGTELADLTINFGATNNESIIINDAL